MAGLCSISTKQATVQNWMLLDVHFTRIFLHNMRKVKSPLCLGCNGTLEDLVHFILHCGYFSTIREKYLPQYITQHGKLSKILKKIFSNNLFLLCLAFRHQKELIPKPQPLHPKTLTVNSCEFVMQWLWSCDVMVVVIGWIVSIWNAKQLGNF